MALNRCQFEPAEGGVRNPNAFSRFLNRRYAPHVEMTIVVATKLATKYALVGAGSKENGIITYGIVALTLTLKIILLFQIFFFDFCHTL